MHILEKDKYLINILSFCQETKKEHFKEKEENNIEQMLIILKQKKID